MAGINPHRPTVLHALDPVPSVLRVSTLGRSTSGPHPRSSPWCLTLVPRTSGYPLSTARVTPAVSDCPSAAAPAPSPPLRGQTLARWQAVARVGVGTEVAAELALTFPVVSLPSGHGPGRCTNPGSMYRTQAESEGSLVFRVVSVRSQGELLTLLGSQFSFV